MSWNRRYRPQRIADLHLHAVRDHFLALLKAGKMPQVFLFAGSKGTGKTSTARILAALLNDPKNEAGVREIFYNHGTSKSPLLEPTASDPLISRIYAGNSFIVTELDAASNRGIDDVRALKERINLPPQEGLMSVYILDEVHMLTTEAFNALLKLLEEPPPHVVFILATTELDKIPPTITSRAQTIRFTKAKSEEIITALQNIIAAEKLTADLEVLETIAARAEGSFRDAVKLLEMVAQTGAITLENAQTILQISVKTQVPALVGALLAKDATQVVQVFEELRQTQVDAKLLQSQLLSHLHQDLLIRLGAQSGTATLPAKSSLFLLKELCDPSLSAPCPIALLPLELKFLELIERAQKKSSPAPSGDSSPTPAKKSSPASKKASTSHSDDVDAQADMSDYDNSYIPEHYSEPETVASPVLPATPHLTDVVPAAKKAAAPQLTTFKETASLTGNGQAICEHWSELIGKVSTQNFGLATLLKAAKPVAGETGKVTVSVFYKFHQEQLLQPKFTKLLDDLFSPIAGGSVQLQCVLAENPATAELTEATESNTLSDLAAASLM